MEKKKKIKFKTKHNVINNNNERYKKVQCHKHSSLDSTMHLLLFIKIEIDFVQVEKKKKMENIQAKDKTDCHLILCMQ